MNLTDKECEDFLSTIYIAAPCDVGWENMTGDDKIRACSLCKKNVYNTSKLTNREAAKLILDNTEDRICLRIYRRRDGTMMTENCPVGLRRIRDAIKFCAVMVLLALAWFGLISEAHAQGLIGAPIDGGPCRGNPPHSAQELDQYNSYLAIQKTQAAVLWASFLGCLLWLGRQIRRNRGSIVLIATSLTLIFAAVGFVHGLLEPDYWGL